MAHINFHGEDELEEIDVEFARHILNLVDQYTATSFATRGGSYGNKVLR